MKCSLTIAISFIVCTVSFGASSALSSLALRSFTPELVVMYRILFGFCFCLIILIFRCLFERDYFNKVKSHLNFKMINIYLLIGGLINLGIPHTLIAVALQWCQSAIIQISRPLTTIVSQIFSHFLFADEKLNRFKFSALGCAFIGVSFNAIPSFTKPPNTTNDTIISYVLIFMGMSLFGAAAVFLKYKTPLVDITISSLIQNLSSFIFCLIFTLICTGPHNMHKCAVRADVIDWIWLLILGIFASGISIQCMMFLIKELGAGGANFVCFGQIIVGVILGIFWLKEWNSYSSWEISISVIGLTLIALAVLIGFIEKPKNVFKSDEEKY